MKPSKTTNRIHFEDLAPDRFEDLCLSIVYRMNRWEKIQHFGRTGNDQGVDIFCEEKLDEGIIRKWFIQCKRYKTITKKQLKNVIDEALKRELPDTLLLIVSCDVSKQKNDYYTIEASKKGIKNPQLWTSSIIEAELYNKHHDILFAFFDINLSKITNSRIATVRRNISLKKKMKNDLTKSIDTSKPHWHCYDKFKYNNLLIRSIDDTEYPKIIPNSLGQYPWYKVEPYDFYYNGIEIILNIQYVEINTEGKWHLKDYDKENINGYKELKTFVIGRIPYELIVDYDPDGDEYYSFAHIFCDFRNNGRPYEEIIYRIINDNVNFHYEMELDNTDREY